MLFRVIRKINGKNLLLNLVSKNFRFASLTAETVLVLSNRGYVLAYIVFRRILKFGWNRDAIAPKGVMAFFVILFLEVLI